MIPHNEPVKNYSPNESDRIALKNALLETKSVLKNLPMYIGTEVINTARKEAVVCPHNHNHILGYINIGSENEIRKAIDAALEAKREWENTDFEARANIFLKAADLLSGKYRYLMNATTMLGQSKNIYQAEIDCICELADFWRFNVYYAKQIYGIQPQSIEGVTNKMEYRPLEGFVYALSPFNFTAIAGNLVSAPALMGNTVVWKPSYHQALSADIIMQILFESGLPKGVINLIYTDGEATSEIVLGHPNFGGIHFTGSTQVFNNIWSSIGKNLQTYKSYPRIVGETGGKDFVLAHTTADLKALAVALIRGAFEYQGQKCSAASRAYIPQAVWRKLKEILLEMLSRVKMGDVENFSNLVNAVIHKTSYKRLVGVIEDAKKNEEIEIVYGGKYDDTVGYFIEPTIFLTKNPYSDCMVKEYFGPILSIYLYDESKFEEVIELIDKTSAYALTGSVFAEDTQVCELTQIKLKHTAGNFYINDKPTGAVVNQQPFGGSRASGTNDKAGSMFNLLRWVSVRTIKTTTHPPHDFEYSFMEAD